MRPSGRAEEEQEEKLEEEQEEKLAEEQEEQEIQNGRLGYDKTWHNQHRYIRYESRP